MAMTNAAPPARPALAALALGLTLAVASPIAAFASDRPGVDPDHVQQVVADRLEGRIGQGDPSSTVQISGSGAFAAVQICNGEVHVATAAGGADGDRLTAAGCEDSNRDTSAIALAASGAVALATEGAALTAPAGAAPNLNDIVALNAAVDSETGSGMNMDMGGHGGMDHGMKAAPEGIGGVSDVGGGGQGRLARMSRGEAGRGMREVHAGREARAGRGDRAGRGGLEASVSGMPNTGVGLNVPAPASEAMAQAIALAAMASAAAAFAVRRREFGLI